MNTLFPPNLRLSDFILPQNHDEFCSHEECAISEDVDIYADRMDVSGFKERPRTLFPFLTKLEVEHPKHGYDKDTTSVIVLDLDEVAAVAAGSESGGSIIGESLLLGGAGIVALWFGTKASVERIIETTDELHELKDERAKLEEALTSDKSQLVSKEAFFRFEQNIKAILEENKKDRRYLKSDRLFSGVIGGAGATGVALGTFLEVPLYATELTSAIGATTLLAAAPVVSAFALGVAGGQAHRFYKAHTLLPKVELELQNAKTKEEQEIYALLKDRVELARKVASVRAVSMTCMAVGAPLTVFAGPYGLAVLLPGVVGGIVAGYIESRKLSYTPQLSWQEKAQLDGKEAIINAIKTAHEECKLLKSMKSQRRLRYPVGASAPQPFKLLAKGAAFVRRKLDEDYKEIPPTQTIFEFLKQNNRVLIQSQERSLSHIEQELIFVGAETMRRAELLEKKEKCLEKLATLNQEMKDLSCLDDKSTPLGSSMFHLLRHLVSNGMFSSFSQVILNDRKLKKQLIKEGVVTKSKNEYHVDANRLVLMLTSKNESREVNQNLAQRLFHIGQDILLTVAKDRAHFRERQLLDFLAAHIALQAKENKPAKLSLIDRLKLLVSRTDV